MSFSLSSNKVFSNVVLLTCDSRLNSGELKNPYKDTKGNSEIRSQKMTENVNTYYIFTGTQTENNLILYVYRLYSNSKNLRTGYLKVSLIS